MIMGNIVDSILFQPPKPSQIKESRITWIRTSTNTKIPALFLEYNDSEASQDSPEPITILYSHANSEDLGHIYPWCKYLSSKLRANIFAYDYTGYGLAFHQGPPSETQCYADIDAAYSYLRKTLHIPAHKIVLYGRSLGTGPSTYLASQRIREEDIPGGLILHAPFTSVYRIVVDSGCTLLGDQFPNIDFFPDVHVPTLFIHGSRDDIVPMNHSLSLFHALRPEFRAPPFFREMKHNSVPPKLRNEFVAHLNQYLDTYIR
jgi:fermentation-respiration switch protein FrsA (DUF1100 family)